MSMFSISDCFATVLPILITIEIGYVLGQKKVFGDNFVKEANHANYVIGFPLLLFCSTVTADLRTLFSLRLVLYSVGSILIMAAAGYFLFGRITDKKKQGALTTTTFRSDILLFAVYITGQLFGQEGIALASMLTAFISPTVTTLSILILNHLDVEHNNSLNFKQTFMNIIKNPFIIAVISGVLYNCSGLPFPEPVLEPLQDIGSMAIPLSLLAIGVQLDFKNVADEKKLIVIGVLARLVVVPGIFVTGAVLLGFRGMPLACLFAQYAAPATVSCYSFAEQMNSDSKLAGSVIVFSTVFAILTIFIGLIILTTLQLL